MSFIDTAAAASVREMREALGLSPEALAAEISDLARSRGWKLGTVHAYTIRRIEGIPERQVWGRVPRIRVQVVLAYYFASVADELVAAGVDHPRNHTDIWKPGRRMKVVEVVAA